jgi:1,4-alpha-glucan branching enzyme
MTSSDAPESTPITTAHAIVLEALANKSIDDVWHHRIGTFVGNDEIVVREHAPNAHFISVIGDFNHWDRGMDPLHRISDTEWEVSINRTRVAPGSRYKLHIAGYNGSRDRIPSTCPFAQQSPDGDFAAIFDFDILTPPTKPISGIQPLKIYELHIGLAAAGPRIGTYLEVAETVIQKVQAAGYTAIQMMAVHEHPYYGSFGYHVSNPFGVCSRFGTRQEFKYLVDKCHALGLKVIVDLVHAHAVKNLAEGLGEFDGQDGYFFLRGSNSIHPAWDSLVYDYQNPFTISYLLSNARYWIEDYGIDGFRVDGVTSILYHDHGIDHACFTDDDYFGNNLNPFGLQFLVFLCHLVHRLKSDAVLIAEDVSGFPGVARSFEEGGVGFDYRLQMGLPDFFEVTAKSVMEQGIIPSQLWHALVSRRFDEKHVGYIESHDQAIVGGQSLIFRLLGPKMYSDMHVNAESHDVHLAMSVINVAKCIVFLLGGEAWMSFIGNEYGHPDWVEFPTPDNEDCLEYAYRKWYLATDESLMYQKMAAFDSDLMHCESFWRCWGESIMTAPLLDDGRRLAVFHRNEIILVTNTSPDVSYEDVWIPVPITGQYRVMLSTENGRYAGYSRLDQDMIYETIQADGNAYIRLYVPSMSATFLTVR